MPRQAMDNPLGKKLLGSQNVTVFEGHKVVEVQGNGFAQRLVLNDSSGNTVTLDAEGTFIEMGLLPRSEIVADLVELDELGRIKVDCYARTSQAGIFAAGDVTDSYAEQVLVAVGEGAKAALSAYEYLLPSI
jgi:alkyl hydroperoxide reductase subunit F